MRRSDGEAQKGYNKHPIREHIHVGENVNVTINAMFLLRTSHE